MKSQNQLILAHLKAGNKITPLDALSKFGCFRLSGRVYDLRKQGHDIKMRMVQRSGKNFAEYSL